jgi:hypothetical protein
MPKILDVFPFTPVVAPAPGVPTTTVYAADDALKDPERNPPAPPPPPPLAAVPPPPPPPATIKYSTVPVPPLKVKLVPESATKNVWIL